jgi:hypothetical protein
MQRRSTSGQAHNNITPMLLGQHGNPLDQNIAGSGGQSPCSRPDAIRIASKSSMTWAGGSSTHPGQP